MSPLQLPRCLATPRLVAPSPSASTSTLLRKSPITTCKTPADDKELGFGLVLSGQPMPPQLHHTTIMLARHSQVTSPQLHPLLSQCDPNWLLPPHQPTMHKAHDATSTWCNPNTAHKTPPLSAMVMTGQRGIVAMAGHFYLR
ncbi:hypothetical protein EDB86DRAFT_2830875 [Lactarius hatsudake]|nr:hypothetical protein EDB86DRAFT_2830875 [Lactarius hatsudake]